MPFGVKPECSKCKCTESAVWKRANDVLQCLQCHNDENRGSPSSSVEVKQEVSEFEKPIVPSVATRKSARLKPQKHRTHLKPLATKGKNRRIIFKRNPLKAPTTVATVMSSKHIFYDGIYWQVGDIASVMDFDGSVYYVQIRGFLQDQFCDKSAVITWLLPTTASPPDRFDPSTYIIGPEEELPRSMNCMEFVCHAPSDYFKSRTTPYPLQDEWRNRPEMCCIYTRMGPKIMSVEAVKDTVENTPREKHVTPAIPPAAAAVISKSQVNTDDTIKKEEEKEKAADKKRKAKAKKSGRKKKTEVKPVKKETVTVKKEPV